MFDAVPPQSVVPLMQSPAYARTAALMGLTVEELGFAEQGMRIGHALMQSRWLPVLGWVGLISRGPLWTGVPDAQVLAQKLQGLRHPVLVNVDGMLGHDLRKAGFVKVMSAASIAQLDLSGRAEDRRARMHQKWRNRLARAEDAGLKIAQAEMDHSSSHWLLEAEHKQRSARKYRGLPTAFVTAYAQANPGQTQVFSALHRGTVVAAMLFLRHGNTATYQIAHTSNNGRKLNAHNLLLNKATEWFVDQGVDMLELGTLDTINAPGLARFKLGSGARARKLGGTWLYSRKLAPFARLLAR